MHVMRNYNNDLGRLHFPHALTIMQIQEVSFGTSWFHSFSAHTFSRLICGKKLYLISEEGFLRKEIVVCWLLARGAWDIYSTVCGLEPSLRTN
jgi:hypothetical protein